MTRSAHRRPPRGGVAALCAAVVLTASAACGDTGRLQLRESAGPFEIALFTSPTPLRAGAVEVNVLVQTLDGHEPVLNADVTVTARAAGGSDGERSAAATRGAGVNQLLYSAVLDMPAPGRWIVTSRIHVGSDSASVSCEVDVAPPLSPLRAFWGYFAFPAVVMALFVLHQWLRYTSRP